MARLESIEKHHLEYFLELVAKRWPIKTAYRALYEEFGRDDCPLCPHYDEQEHGAPDPDADPHPACGFSARAHMTYPSFWRYVDSDEGAHKLDRVRAGLRAKATTDSYADTRLRIISLVEQYEVVLDRLRDPTISKGELVGYSTELRQLDKAIRDNLDRVQARVSPDQVSGTRIQDQRQDVEEMLESSSLPEHAKEQIRKTYNLSEIDEGEVH